MKNKGFTILELLISIAVITILTSVSFWGYNAKKDTMALRSEANNLLARAESVRERSLGAQFWHGVLPVGGYGIVLKLATNEYITFADCDGDGILDPDSDLTCNGIFRERMDSWKLTNNIQIQDLLITTQISSDAVDEFTILYKFPFPEAVISDSGIRATAILRVLNDPTKEKTINFETTGLIYVQ